VTHQKKAKAGSTPRHIRRSRDVTKISATKPAQIAIATTFVVDR